MSAYKDFISNPVVKPGKIARLWELEVNGKIDNLLDFCRQFLKQIGFNYTGYQKDECGIHKAVFNGSYIWDGAIQEGSKIAIRISQI